MFEKKIVSLVVVALQMQARQHKSDSGLAVKSFTFFVGIQSLICSGNSKLISA